MSRQHGMLGRVQTAGTQQEVAGLPWGRRWVSYTVSAPKTLLSWFFRRKEERFEAIPSVTADKNLRFLLGPSLLREPLGEVLRCVIGGNVHIGSCFLSVSTLTRGHCPLVATGKDTEHPKAFPPTVARLWLFFL